MLMIISTVTSVMTVICLAWFIYTIAVHCFDVGNPDRWARWKPIWNKWYTKLIPVFVVLTLIEICLRW